MPLNTTPPVPMPSAAASPARRESPIALRATTMKLGPGLMTPSNTAPRIAMTALAADIEYSFMDGQERETASDKADAMRSKHLNALNIPRIVFFPTNLLFHVSTVTHMRNDACMKGPPLSRNVR